jgi:hypothetical protein
LLPWALASDGTSAEPAMRGAAQLLRQHFQRVLLLRTALAVLLGLATIAWTFSGALTFPGSLAGLVVVLSIAIEAAGRYLFFRCVVPRNMPMNFFAGKPAH